MSDALPEQQIPAEAVSAAEQSHTHELFFGERKITLLGTAHVSEQSVQEVSSQIRTRKPDCVCIELDSQRLEAMRNPESWKNLDIIHVLKNKQGFVLFANLILASFQKRMGAPLGVKPGDDMRAGVDTAEELGIRTEVVDRPVQITLRRAWAANSLMGKNKLLSALIVSAFDTEKVSGEQIESLKKESEMDSMMNELSEYLPEVKKVLIDERDRYLAAKIWAAGGLDTLAVLGAGHIPGVTAHLEKLASGEEQQDVSDISEVQSKKKSKILGWLVPALIVALIVLGFWVGGRSKGWNMMGAWFLWNGALAALGTILAAGHPLTILAAFISAPFTSLCPLVGVGMVTGIVQAVFCKPKVRDMESLQEDVTGIRSFYRNRILRVLLVFILSSLGSSIGTFVAGASFVKTLHSTQFITKIVSRISSLFL